MMRGCFEYMNMTGTIDPSSALPESSGPADPSDPTDPAGARPQGRKSPRSRPAGQAGQSAQPRQRGAQPPRTSPVLEKLAGFYPHLFGAEFLPLKRGVFEDLLTAHPDEFEREALKEALSQHTRSSRYLTSVAAGRPRHDLQGAVNEAMAPEHVHHALLEVFRRRARRGGEDLRPQLRKRIAQAFEASGLPAAEYAQLVRSRDEEANQLLDEALADTASNNAKGEALLRAFEASGQSVDDFAGMYGLDPREAAATLERARRAKA